MTAVLADNLAKTTRFKVITEGQLVQKVAPTVRHDGNVNDAVRISLRKKRRECVSPLTDVSHTLHPLVFLPLFLSAQRNQQQ